MGSKAERRSARALVATYHEARLADLLEHVADALERYRTGELDAYAVDEVIHRYKRATRELWKFCFGPGSGSYVEIAALAIEHQAAEGEPIDWWEAAASTRP